MSTIPTNRDSDRFMLRLPDGMRDEIKRMAELNGRSMNAEIVFRLQESLAPAGNMHSFVMGALLSALDNPKAKIDIHLDQTKPDERARPHWIHHVEVRFSDGKMFIPNPTALDVPDDD